MAETRYFRIMLGQHSKFAEQCFSGGFIGADFGINQDLTSDLPEDWREFNANFIPIFLSIRPDKTKVAAGLACGMLHTVSKGIKEGEFVLCPDGSGNYKVGRVTGGYRYVPGEVLPHRRSVEWLSKHIPKEDMSDGLRNSAGSIGTVSNISKHAAELEKLLSGETVAITVSDETIEDPSVFALEKHLEEFLIANWSSTELGVTHDIFEDDGELIGQQYPTDTGFIDILAISKDRSELLVVELKKGRASDSVVGQVQRYMGYLIDEVAEPNQSVRGCIIALEDDLRIRRALRINPSIDFYRYEVTFSLRKQ